MILYIISYLFWKLKPRCTDLQVQLLHNSGTIQYVLSYHIKSYQQTTTAHSAIDILVAYKGHYGQKHSM